MNPLPLLALALLVGAAQLPAATETPPLKMPAANSTDAKEPAAREQIEKLAAMSPEERREYIKSHPEIRESLQARFQNMSEENKAKLKERFQGKAAELTPEQKEKMREKFSGKKGPVSEEQAAAVLKEHPELKEKLDARKKAAASTPDKVSPPGDTNSRPEMLAKLKAHLETLSPEEREKFIAEHPRAKAILEAK